MIYDLHKINCIKKMRKLVIITCLLISILQVKAQQIGNGWTINCPDFSGMLNSGAYEGCNPINGVPDAAHPWQHLLVLRHSNSQNNHQFQLGTSYSENDRIFFRKIASALEQKNTVWNELATRGANRFIGNQIFNDGNIGIGTTSPSEKLEVVGVMRTINQGLAAATWDNLSLWSDGENSYIHANGDEKGLHIKSNTGGKILLESNVGIGTQNPDQMLTVKGKIHAEEIIVDLAVPADYVFKPNYKLMPLHQVEQFVKTNSHLPEIPSANEITKNGLSVGEMQNKLLQKVEELTLYVIQQQKKIDELERKMK